MSLNALLEIGKKHERKMRGDMTLERIEAQIPILRQYIAYWREYPDMFVEFLCGDNPQNFSLYFYQRCFLRAALRYRKVYATFPRGYSKSFLSFLALMLKCILYPGIHLFVTTGGKEQATSIAKEKTELLCKLIPGLAREVNFDRGKSKSSKDTLDLLFRNGSVLNIMAARQSSRGRRANGGLMEECILIDQQLLNEVILPTMVIDRRLSDGSRVREETVNRSQIYITTAGWKNSFAYAKQMELLIQMITDPTEAFVMGGTWRVPVMEGLQPKSFIQEAKLDGTYSDGSFSREYESCWSGDSESAFFSADKFDRCRTLLTPEYERSFRNSSGQFAGAKDAYYVLGVDVGRKGCNSECCVFRANSKMGVGGATKALVNIYSWKDTHFETLAIELKRLYYRYKARILVIDGNGLGIGLIDEMVKEQTDPDTGEILPPFGIENDEEKFYKQYETPTTVKNAIHIMKANLAINSECHQYVQAQMHASRIKFLVDENVAKAKLLSTKAGQDLDSVQRAEQLFPFTQTTILRAQMLNLIETNEGVNIRLKQASSSIPKDKFSAFEYGLFYIKKQEERFKGRKKRDISKMLYVTSR